MYCCMTVLVTLRANYGGHLQRGGYALRHERCSRGSPLPSRADYATLDRSFIRPFYPEVPDCHPPYSLPSDAPEEHRLWLLYSHLCGLTTQQARSRFTSLLCEMWCQESAPLADPRPALYLCGSGRRSDNLRTRFLPSIPKNVGIGNG
jgi:hypothetical protein